MSILCKSLTFSLIAAVLLGGGTAVFAQPASRMQPAQSPPVRMKVVETQFSQNSPASFYTIVGAVHVPGVYQTERQSVTLGNLVEAAKGLQPFANPTLRIVRNGEVRFQVPYSSESVALRDPLLRGDIVVVSTDPRALEAGHSERIVPVVCLGLADRPVVLPLDPSITTIQELAVHRLGQTNDFARSARIVGPVRQTNGPELVSGSVIYFDYRLLNAFPLQQHSILPAAISLDEIRTSAYPGSAPIEMGTPPAVPPAEVIQQVTADMITPPQLDFVRTPVKSASQQEVSQVSVEMTSPPTSSVPPLSQTASTEEAVAPLVLEVPAQRSEVTMPSEIAQALDLFAPLDTPVDRTPRATVEASPPQMPTAAATSAVIPVAGQNAVSKNRRSEVETAAGEVEATRPSSDVVRSASRLEPRSARKISTKKLGVFEYLLMAGASISILTGLYLLGSLAFYSTSEEVKTGSTAHPSVPPAHPSEVPSTVQPVAEECVSPPPLPQNVVSAKQVSGRRIQELLDRSMPIVEEVITINNSWPLHGKVIGHRNFVVHGAHNTISGPHFTKSEKTAEIEKVSVSSHRADEERLRKSLRELYRSQTESRAAESLLGNSVDSGITESCNSELPKPLPLSFGEERLHPETSPVPSAFVANSPAPAETPPISILANQEMDIVQPPSQPSITPSMSPLERALRTLASEKRG